MYIIVYVYVYNLQFAVFLQKYKKKKIYTYKIRFIRIINSLYITKIGTL